MSRVLRLFALAILLYGGASLAADVPLNDQARALIAPVAEAYKKIDLELAALPPPENDSERLVRLKRRDSAGRNAYAAINFFSLPEDQRLTAFHTAYAEINRRDLENQAQFKTLLPREGWFLKSRYSQDAIDAAWLIVQHAVNMDPALLHTVLASMERLLPTGEVDKHQYAMVYDRAAMSDGRFQRYGSQMICKNHKWVVYPVESPEQVDAKRTEMGFGQTLSKQVEYFSSRQCPADYDRPLPK